MIHVNASVKSIARAKKYYGWNPSRYLKSIADTLVSVSNEVINAMDNSSTNVWNIVPTNMTNTISTNVTNTM